MNMVEQMQSVQVMPNSLCLWGLGQMGVAVQGPDAVLYFDPCLSNVVEEQFGAFWQRGYPPPIAASAITNASYLLISHEHLDHLDPQTAPAIMKASPNAKIVTPRWCQDELNRLDIADDRVIYTTAHQTIQLPGTSARVTPVPGAHYGLDYDEEKDYRWVGFVVEWNGVKFYHAGDTVIYPDYIETMRRHSPLDLAMVPVNGRDWYRESEAGAIGNLLPVEMARLARDLGWDTLIPGHNDLYPNNAIPFADIIAALEKINPRQRYKQLQPGEPYYYVKPGGQHVP